MSSNDYSPLHVLIVDDFHNFRRALAKSIYELGFRHIDSVGSGEEALGYCRKQHYDLIISDYNLGPGKNGQQLLEELSIGGYRRVSDIFMLISADTSRHVVMCSYDCEPDAFLAKPVTGKTLEQRIQRVVEQRKQLRAVYNNIEAGDYATAIFILEQEIEQKSRYTVDCQKMLGELYVQQGQYDKAEELYQVVLAARELDWAMVGLANVVMAQGHTEQAIISLEQILDKNPAYLKAYDSLSKACEIIDDKDKLQYVLERATEVSPMSTGRQKQLADTALNNGNVELAVKAYKKTIKYGSNSHYDTPENHLNFARAITKIFDNDIDKAKEFSREAAQLLTNLDDKYEVNKQQYAQAKLLNSQIHALEGDVKKSNVLLHEAKGMMDGEMTKNIDTDIEIVNAFIVTDRRLEATNMLQELVEYYKNDEEALEKLDPLLDEPVSAKGKHTIAKINTRGISAYQSKDYHTSIDCFSRAQRKFPRYIGLKLNLIQAMISSMRDHDVNEDYIIQCKTLFKVIERYITPTSEQFTRYKQLQAMLRHLTHGYE